MALTLKELQNKIVPSKSKDGSAIDDQWLKPASFDKKMVKAMTGDKPEMYDQEEHEAENFTVQDKIKKNTKAPLREMDAGPVEKSISDNVYSVNALYEEESLDLLEEIMDLIESINEDSEPSHCWRDISSNLKTVRDTLVGNLNESENTILEETFKSGVVNLTDKTTVKLSKDDAKALNLAVSNTANKDKLVKQITKTKKDFKEFIEFARNIDEDFEGGIEALLSEASIEDLEYIIENDLDESKSWEIIKKGTRNGAAIGGTAGMAVGVVTGGIYGGIAGAGLAAIRKYQRKAANRDSKEQEDDLAKFNKEYDGKVWKYSMKEDENNEKESVLGTAEPAMDSEPKKKKKVDEGDLQEISKDLAAKYIIKSSDDKENIQTIQSVMSRDHYNQHRNGPIKKQHDRMSNNRDTGIRRALNIIKKDK